MLEPLADHGYWLAVMFSPAARAAAIRAMTAGAWPCTSTPSALMCETCAGICAARAISISSSIAANSPTV